jgi:4-diphosphocytidyl-2-C-methyl-D-erythritol kinase
VTRSTAAKRNRKVGMVFFPNAKINLGLHVIGRRPDGFHNIETVFYPIPLCDAAEILRSDDNDLSFNYTGINLPGNAEDNLCIKAYRLLKNDIPTLPGIQFHLHKAIPAGAGLGGGSADAAFMLKALNEYFDLSLSASQLHDYAIQLGSDCPFFILNQPALATGRGEVLTPVNINLSAYSIVIVNPGIHVNTGNAFSMLTPATPAHSLNDVMQAPVSSWKYHLVNDFEASVSKQHPPIAEIKNSLYDAGATYVSMSGSGSTVYGLFEGAVPNFNFPADYMVKIIPKQLG